MKAIKIALSVLSISIASSFSQAEMKTDSTQVMPTKQEQKISGFYLGGTIGSSRLSATDSDYTGSLGLEDRNYTDDMDTQDSSFKILAGYQFNRIVGVEVTYTDFGTFEHDIIGHSISPTAFTVAANIGYTFQSGWRPFALVGLSEVDIGQTDSEFFDGDSASAIHYGAGVEFAPVSLRGLAFRATWESDLMAVEYVAGQYDDFALVLSGLSIGATYKF